MDNQSSEANVRNYYDEFMYDRVIEEYFGRSGFHNLGLWDSDTDTAVEACRALIAELITLSPPHPNTVLEVGCGRGATTKEFCAGWPQARITAIDVSEIQIEACMKNCPKATVKQMDACNMTFAESSFDLVISVEAAFQFPSRKRFLENALRVLKPGGRLVLQDLLHHERVGSPIVLPDTLRQENAGPWSAAGDTDKQILDPAILLPSDNYLANPTEYRDLVSAVGFENCEVIDVTAAGPRRFYPHFLKHLGDHDAWKGYDPERVRMLRVGARLFARNVSYCVLVRAEAPRCQQ